MTPKEEVNRAVIQLYIALRDYTDAFINDPDQMPKEDLALLMPITSHSAVQNALSKAMKNGIYNP